MIPPDDITILLLKLSFLCVLMRFYTNTHAEYEGTGVGLGALQEDRGAAQRKDLGGFKVGKRINVLFYAPILRGIVQSDAKNNIKLK